MKKFMVFVCSLCMILTSLLSVSAGVVNIDETSRGASFEIQDIIEYAQAYGIRDEDALVRIPVKLSLNDELNSSLLIEIEPKEIAARQVKNFNVSGNFYRTSDHTTVSVYGLSGSFEYTGNDTKITGKDSYHNSTASGWWGTSRTSTSKDINYHVSVLKGDYTLFKDGKENNTAWIKIAVSENGIYTVGGDYISYNVN